MGLNKWVVREVVPCRDYTLLITFANGKRKVFDVKPLLEAKINEPLKDMDFFMQARVCGPSVGWSDGLDDDRGTSLAVAHSPTGEELLLGLENCLVREIPVEAGVRHNPAYYRSCERPPLRTTFFTDLQKVSAGAMDFPRIFKKYGRDAMPRRIYRFVRRCGGKGLRLMGLRK